MKEATGELNVTVITIVAIAAVAAFFYAFVWPAIQTRLQNSQVCSNPPGTILGSANTDGYVNCGSATSGKYTCSYNIKGSNKTTTCKINS